MVGWVRGWLGWLVGGLPRVGLTIVGKFRG